MTRRSCNNACAKSRGFTFRNLACGSASKTRTSGFTLVELAIVMTIIGLLIGGILKGQELMENARVTATIAQVRSYEAATTTFRDTYAAIPGDMKNAGTRIPGCNTRCDLSNTQRGGDSIIGEPGELGANQAQGIMAAGTEPEKETILFWVELGLADLIAGVTDEIINNPGVSPAWGESHPAAKIGGGFHIKHADGNAPTGAAPDFPDDAPGGNDVIPSGLFLVLTNSPTTDLDLGANAAGQNPLSPNRAAQIDRKMDDGEPTRGFVRGYGDSTTNMPGNPGCFLEDTVGGSADGYNEQSTQKDCGLLFRIQG